MTNSGVLEGGALCEADALEPWSTNTSFPGAASRNIASTSNPSTGAIDAGTWLQLSPQSHLNPSVLGRAVLGNIQPMFTYNMRHSDFLKLMKCLLPIVCSFWDRHCKVICSCISIQATSRCIPSRCVSTGQGE